ncbi:MAG: orotidine-5'-phosphate decarboxylase [Patescibacteria group bacterium]|nr:orotidine-5'-phosphate decarboxylase [Patescibacteria group bacterium]
MNARNFFRLLEARWAQDLFVCVGLDSDLSKIPEAAQVSDKTYPVGLDPTATIFGFNSAIVDATKDLVCAYKPNIAFYEAHGGAGWLALYQTVTYIHEVAPEVPVILDAKRADIGNTNNGYVRAFELLQVDAITVNPYLGAEALQPFLDQKDRGIIVLCRTSNPGAGEFQDMVVSVSEEQFANISRGQPVSDSEFSMPRTMPLYQYVAYRVAARSTGWNKNGNCAIVVGATYPGELREVRQQIVGDMPILIPGIGKQGGDIEKTVAAGIDSRGQGIIVNSSRGIIFASGGSDFAEAARRETVKLSDTINDCRQKGE